MAKSDTVKARFKAAIERHNQLKNIDYITPLRQFTRIEAPPVDQKNQLRDFFSVDQGSPLARAFQETGFDASDPYAWKRLLRIFAAAHFPAETRGLKPRRTSQQSSQLLLDYERTKQAAKKGTNEEKIAQTMTKTLTPYRDMRPGTLRRVISTVKKERRDAEVEELAHDILDLYESRPESSELSFTAMEKLARQQAAKAFPAQRSGRKITR